MAIGDCSRRVSRREGGTARGISPGRGPGCPSWCDGYHEVDDHIAAYHGRIVAQHGNAVVALSAIAYRDPAETGTTKIILDTGTAAGPGELEESEAIRLLGTLQATDDGPSWLAGALRAALDLLDPHAGWARHR